MPIFKKQKRMSFFLLGPENPASSAGKHPGTSGRRMTLDSAVTENVNVVKLTIL
jgi:hypothetical protein